MRRRQAELGGTKVAQANSLTGAGGVLSSVLAEDFLKSGTIPSAALIQ